MSVANKFIRDKSLTLEWLTAAENLNKTELVVELHAELVNAKILASYSSSLNQTSCLGDAKYSRQQQFCIETDSLHFT